MDTNILELLHCVSPYLTVTTLRQLSCIISGLLALSGRVTMLGISRWAGKGGSYRTVQRFYATVIPWAMVFWLFFRVHLYDATDVYLLAGDECVVPKAGKHTYGLGRFFSSLYGKPIPGVTFFTLALISTRQRRSFPIMVEQMRAHETCKAAPPRPAQKAPVAQKRAVGRPKGCKNKDKTQVTLTPELTLIQTMVLKLLLLLNGLFSLRYLVLDGHFGHNNALQMTRQCGGLHLISKLRRDAALYFPYDGPYSGRGPHRKYGAKLDYAHIPQKYRREISVADDVQTEVYQMTMLHKSFAQPLNIVIIVKTNLKTHARAHVVLFSSDLKLAYDLVIDYYRLRFQIEFNFRDAKQYWGLDDFMNVNQTPVTNAANLALFMVNIAQSLLADLRQHNPRCGVLDLKAYFRGRKYVTETLKLLPEIPDPILLTQIYAHIATLGSIHLTDPLLDAL